MAQKQAKNLDDLMQTDGPHLMQSRSLTFEETHQDAYGYAYSARAMRRTVPKHTMPEEPLPAVVVKTLIDDEMLLDGNPRQNLASFVTTWMETEAEQVMNDAARKNYIDIDEYPQCYEIQKRCVNMICRLWNAPLEPEQDGTGTACVGSSEAIMLAVLAMKWRWREKRKAAGKPHDKPNLVMGANAQICWKKALRYFDIEERWAYVSPDNLVLTAERAKPLIDENTIGVCPILGSTFEGTFEDVKGIHDMVEQLNKETAWGVPIHVDAASGGFIAPFLTPELVWDFRLPLVKSINASGHKFGLVYAGIGWLCFRENQDLPEDLVFHVNYLGGDQASFTLNFSRGASHIVGQYYNFLRLGKEGYRQVLLNAMSNAEYLRQTLRETGKVDIVDRAHMPLVAFSLKESAKLPYTVFEIQDKLRGRGWIVPAYKCCHGAEDLAIMRVVVKENFSRDLAEMLVTDFLKAIEFLEKEHEEHTALIHKALEAGAQGHDGPPGSKRQRTTHDDAVRIKAHHASKHPRRSKNIANSSAHRNTPHTTKGIC